MKPGTDEVLEGAVAVLEAAEPFDAATLEAGLRELIEREGSPPTRCCSRSASRSPARPSRRASSSRSRRSVATTPCSACIGRSGTSGTVCPGMTATRANGPRRYLPIRVGTTTETAQDEPETPRHGSTHGYGRKNREEAPGSGPGQGRAKACSGVRRGRQDAGPRGDRRAGREGRLPGELLGHRDHRARRDRHGDGDRRHEVRQQRRRPPRPDLQRARCGRDADAGRHPGGRHFADDLRHLPVLVLLGEPPRALSPSRRRDPPRGREPGGPRGRSRAGTSSRPRPCFTTSASSC